MDRLRGIDKVAYVRFASVYLDFKDVQEFMTELKDLLKTKEAEPKGKSRNGCDRAISPWRRLTGHHRNIEIMAHKITLIPGDGIGPEVIQRRRSHPRSHWRQVRMGELRSRRRAFEKYKEYIPKELYRIDRAHPRRLEGPVTTPIGGGFSQHQRRRCASDLSSSPTSAPSAICPALHTRYPGLDLIIVRENTEGLYSGIEHEVVPGVVESLKIITEKASTRIARFAFEYARASQRKKIHASTKPTS